jgi:hypothetical protein
MSFNKGKRAPTVTGTIHDVSFTVLLAMGLMHESNIHRYAVLKAHALPSPSNVALSQTLVVSETDSHRSSDSPKRVDELYFEIASFMLPPHVSMHEGGTFCKASSKVVAAAHDGIIKHKLTRSAIVDIKQ